MKSFPVDRHILVGAPSDGPELAANRNRAKRWLALKVGVSFALLLFLFSRMDVSGLYRIIAAAHWKYLVAAAGVLLAAKLLSAFRWALLAGKLGFHNPAGEFSLYYFFGMFFNLFMPSTVGGDAVRVFYLVRGQIDERWKSSTGRAVISVAADRLIGGIVLLWIGAVALLAFPSYAAALPWTVRGFIWTAAVGSVLIWPLLWLAGPLLPPWAGSLWIKKLEHWTTPYRHDPRLLCQALLISLAVHFLQTWIQILIGRSIDLNIPWSYCFIFFPLVDILTMLPLTVSGIGLREGGYFYFLGRLHIGAEPAIACGMLWFAVVLANGLLGGAAFLLYRKSPLVGCKRPTDT